MGVPLPAEERAQRAVGGAFECGRIGCGEGEVRGTGSGGGANG